MRENHRSRTVGEDMIVDSVDLLRPSLGKVFPLSRVVKIKASREVGKSFLFEFFSFY